MNPITLSLLSGCVWSAIAYLLAHFAFGNRIWAGIVAGPLIGACIGGISRFAKSRPEGLRIAVSLFDLYLAAACFGIAMTAHDFLGKPANLNLAAKAMENVLVVFWGLTFTGYFLLLWPLSWLNHLLVWDQPPSESYDR
jgi:hypothetical protein